MWRIWAGPYERWLSTTAGDRQDHGIIDCLTTFGRVPKQGSSTTPLQLRDGLASQGVEKCASLSLRGVYYDSLEGNTETLRASNDFPFIIPAATLDPRRFYGKLDQGLDLGAFKIMRVFPDVQGWPTDYAPFERILECAQMSGLLVMAPVQDRGNATRLSRAAAKYGLPLIITSVNYSTLSEVLALFHDHEKLHISTDMLNTPDGIELITDEFGPERLIFGSNYPATYFRGPLLAVQRAEIGPGAKRKILWENAARLMGIK